jgi:hypothetical protein
MHHAGKSLAVVVDPAGKVGEFGRVAGAMSRQVGLSTYTVAVTVAWTLLASDLKQEIEGMEMKVDKLIDLATTAEHAEFEEAYNSIRSLGNKSGQERRLVLTHAITVTEKVRIRRRERLSNQSQRLSPPKLSQRLFGHKQWPEDQVEAVDQNIRNLDTLQLGTLLEAYLLILLGDSERNRMFSNLMQQEARALRRISFQYKETWDEEKRRLSAKRPLLIAATERFAPGLELGQGKCSDQDGLLIK